MILGSHRKKWQKKVMSEKNQGLRHGRREVEDNDKNNVIADKNFFFFGYFW